MDIVYLLIRELLSIYLLLSRYHVAEWYEDTFLLFDDARGITKFLLGMVRINQRRINYAVSQRWERSAWQESVVSNIQGELDLTDQDGCHGIWGNYLATGWHEQTTSSLLFNAESFPGSNELWLHGNLTTRVAVRGRMAADFELFPAEENAFPQDRHWYSAWLQRGCRIHRFFLW